MCKESDDCTLLPKKEVQRLYLLPEGTIATLRYLTKFIFCFLSSCAFYRIASSDWIWFSQFLGLSKSQIRGMVSGLQWNFTWQSRFSFNYESMDSIRRKIRFYYRRYVKKLLHVLAELKDCKQKFQREKVGNGPKLRKKQKGRCLGKNSKWPSWTGVLPISLLVFLSSTYKALAFIYIL